MELIVFSLELLGLNYTAIHFDFKSILLLSILTHYSIEKISIFFSIAYFFVSHEKKIELGWPTMLTQEQLAP
jgi:hypothetical protein